MKFMRTLFIFIYIFAFFTLLFGKGQAETSDLPQGFPYEFIHIAVEKNQQTENLKNFAIGKYEVSYTLWYEIYQWAVGKKYVFKHKGSEGYFGVQGASPDHQYQNIQSGKDLYPITNISWADAVVWCNAANDYLGVPATLLFQ